MKAPLPDNEAERLEASLQCKILDTAPKQVVDDKLLELRGNLGALKSTAISRQSTQKKRQRFFKQLAVVLGLASVIFAGVVSGKTEIV